MRALFLDVSLESLDEKYFEVEGDKARQLIKVSRIKRGEEVLILNGKGLKASVRVHELKSKSVQFEIVEKKVLQKNENPLELALCVIKKDALELSLKMCVELGVNNLYLISSEYSQKFNLKEERVQKILESAYEQSNCPFSLRVNREFSLKNFDFKAYENVIFYESKFALEPHSVKLGLGKSLLVIGPEGGFSKKEVNFLESLDNSKGVHLKTNIMRAPTALCCAYGQCLELLSS